MDAVAISMPGGAGVHADAPARLYVPEGHASCAADPPAQYDPAVQDGQLVRLPEETATVPGGHETGPDGGSGHANPAAQDTHASLSAFDMVPAAQDVQEVAPAAEMVPIAHRTGGTETDAQLEPAGHLVQSTEPVALA